MSWQLAFNNQFYNLFWTKFHALRPTNETIERIKKHNHKRSNQKQKYSYCANNNENEDNELRAHKPTHYICIFDIYRLDVFWHCWYWYYCFAVMQYFRITETQLANQIWLNRFFVRCLYADSRWIRTIIASTKMDNIVYEGRDLCMAQYLQMLRGIREAVRKITLP